MERDMLIALIGLGLMVLYAGAMIAKLYLRRNYERTDQVIDIGQIVIFFSFVVTALIMWPK